MGDVEEMNRVEVRASGLGGQGVVMLGRILAAAAIYQGKEVTQLETYGMQQRGGDVRCDVVISDEEIDYPEVTEADIMILMSQDAFDRHIQYLKKGGMLIVDSLLVTRFEVEDKTASIYKIHATEIARVELGNAMVVNVVMLGAFMGLTGLLSEDFVQKAIAENVPKKAIELNLKAFKRGLEEGLKVKGA